MIKSLKSALCVLLSFQIVAYPTFAMAQVPGLEKNKTEDLNSLKEDQQLTYWGKLDNELPVLTEFALGEPISDQPLWTLDLADPILDENPFFMRTQNWEASQNSTGCKDSLCFRKEQNGSLILSGMAHGKALRINESLTPVLETESHLILTADNDSLFRKKTPNSKKPGEGFFFINKRDLVNNSRFPVPLFFFPLPDYGWTGNTNQSFEFSMANQVVLVNQSGFGLPIDVMDILFMEKSQRDNLVLSQAWSFLEGKVSSEGVALPKPKSTMSYGIMMSGVLPEMADRATRQGLIEKFKSYMQEVSFIPKAFAQEKKPSVLERLRSAIAGKVASLDKEYWKRWIAPAVMYGGTFLAAGAIYVNHPIDFGTLITEDMPERLAIVGSILGVVGAASVLMKYTIHKTIFDKKYPIEANDTWLQKVNKEHKGILDELAHGLYFSLAVIPQSIRHMLEFLKDHFMPSNQMVHKAWEATMGFQMKQNSHLAMNWKTFYLGAMVFGMADSILVGVHLLIFTPFIIDYFNISVALGAATAAFASSEVLRNFLGYIQGGAHSYSADVKFIHMKSAEEVAKKQLALQGIDGNAPKNQGVVQKLMEAELEKRFKTVGLPGPDEFLYDPIYLLEKINEWSGFSLGDLNQYTDEQKAMLAKQHYVLSKRRWGLIQPALKKALAQAKEIQSKSPSATGAKTIQLLEWAIADRSGVKAVAGRTWDAVASKWGRMGLQESIQLSTSEWLAGEKTPTWYGAIKAATKGAYKYLAVDSTKEVRDIRKVLFMMSSTSANTEMAELLPQSWREKAGSDEAAVLGAELFHRSFFSFIEGKPDLIAPSENLRSRYGARAEKILERIGPKVPALADPFVRSARHEQIMFQLKTRDEARLNTLNFKPKSLSAWEQSQWNTAQKEAERVMRENPVDEKVEREWLGFAERYNQETDSSVDTQTYAANYKYRTLMAQQMAKTMGLNIKNVEDSKFVQKVLVVASQETETQLGHTKEKIYLRTLSPEDQKFYEARVFTNHFINTYIGMSVHEDSNFSSGESPEYPGRFQAIRKAVAGKPFGNLASRVVRSFEAAFRNEETSYTPGFWGFLDRNLPVIPDMFHNFVRTLRIMPYVLTLSYLTSYYIWQIQMPYSLWVFFITVGFVAPALVEFNNRLQKNFGLKPMGDVPSKLTYGFIHSTLTNPEVMLIQAYAEPISNTFDNHVTKPIKGLINDCGDFLRGRK